MAKRKATESWKPERRAGGDENPTDVRGARQRTVPAAIAELPRANVRVQGTLAKARCRRRWAFRHGRLTFAEPE